MTSRGFARAIGAVFVTAGVLGFIPGLKSPAAPLSPPLSMHGGYGLLFGLFAVNWIHNLVHLGIGLSAWRSSRTMVEARRFARGLALFYGALAVMGLIPALNSAVGLIPLFGHDTWLHAGTAAAAAYFGYAPRMEAMEIRERYRRAA
ncbi:MAG TPA: DUF4383 domain-containing protein [Nitrospira sp.]|nr:DUF4383 domain-containing protein [Nitrospira sp.]